MNRENVLKVADAIENHTIEGLGFNMLTYGSEHYRDRSGHNCGTVACIAGYAQALSGDIAEYIPTQAKLFLDLTDDEANELFLRTKERHEIEYNVEEDLCKADELLDNTTPQEAVDVLRYLAATGKVDWHWSENDPSFGFHPKDYVATNKEHEHAV